MWQQRKEILKAIGSRHQDDHRNVELRDILLVLDVLIGGYESIELGAGKTQQFAVPLRRPSAERNGDHFMVREVQPQILRQRLIEEKLHRASRARVLPRT